MVAEVAAAAWATLCVLESAVPAELRGAMLLADVLQVGSAVWIMRYSRE